MSSGPIQLFLRHKFTQKELLTSKKEEARHITSLINFLTSEDISIIIEYKNYIDNMIDPKHEAKHDSKNDPKNEENYFFKPSATFTGYKPGWVFKTGDLGLGYYLDTKPIF